MDANLSKRRKNMIDIIITLIPLICMSVYFYRMRVVIMLAFAILLSAGLDMIGNLLLGRKSRKNMIFRLLLPL